ncbi:MAG: antitoxin Xre/MbcA/ParS toxin-binding domain-containing protein [Ferruginibacter sp.]
MADQKKSTPPIIESLKKGKKAVQKINGSDSTQIKFIILKEKSGKPESHMTPIEKMEISHHGVSKNDLEGMKKILGVDYDRLGEALSVTRATLINKKGTDKFHPLLSERIISLADIYSYGYEVFGDEQNFNSWMLTENKALGWKKPYDVMSNQFGREEVKNIIGRIAWGVFS